MDGRQLLPRLALVLVLAGGCAGSGGDDDDKSRGASKCTAPEQPTISLAANIQPIFDQSCALSGCHVGAVPAGGLDLSAGQTHGDTVGVPSIQRRRVDRVVPGDPDASYLVRKIEGGPEIAGLLMPQGCPGTPLNGAVCLTPDAIAAIRTWIMECALDN